MIILMKTMTPIKMYINIKKSLVSFYFLIIVSIIGHVIALTFFKSANTDSSNSILAIRKKEMRIFQSNTIQINHHKSIENKTQEKLDLSNKFQTVQSNIEKIQDSDVTETRNNYLNLISSIIERNTVFPRQAIRLKKNGEVLIRFEISKQGTTSNIQLIEKSDFDPFNVEAISVIKKIGDFPAIPEEIALDSLQVEQKIKFIKNTP